MSIVEIDDQELDLALEVYDAVGDERDKWRILDEEGANKYMRIVRRLEGQMADVTSIRTKEVQRIEGFYDAQWDELNGKAEFFRGLLIDWYKRQREVNPKYQLKTPWGKVSSRRVKSPQWINEDATLSWLKASGHGDLVKVEESIRKADLKKAMNEADGCYIDPMTGEVVPGVVVEDRMTISVKTEV